MTYDWYARYVRSWRGGTRHMTYAEKGAYAELIDEYMDTGEPVPDNDRALASITGGTLEEWLEVAPVVRAKFESSNGKLINERCETELYARSMRGASRTKQAKVAARKRWDNNKLNAASNAHAMPVAMQNDATLHKNNLLLSLNSAPREAQPMIINGKDVHPTPELLELVARQNRQRGILTPSSSATALPTGAPPPPASAATTAVNGKPAILATREEMEALFEAKRSKKSVKPPVSPSDEAEEIPF